MTAEQRQANPFDDFADPSDGDRYGEIRQAPGPSLSESFVENFAPMVGGITAKARTLADQRTVQRAEREGVAQPGDSPFAGKVSQAEADAARQRYAATTREREAYEAFHSDTVAGKAAGLIGGVLGGFTDPAALIGGGGVLARGGAATAQALGISGRLATYLGVGLEGGAVNAALDAAGQELDIASGQQTEGYSGTQTAAAFGLGAGLGAGMHGIAEIIGRHLAQRKAAQGAENVPPAPPPAERADPPLAQDPAIDGSEQQAARAARALPDETVAKAADTAEASPAAGAEERVVAAADPADATLLKESGIDVEADGSVPTEQAAALIRERDARETGRQAVEQTERPATQTEGKPPEADPATAAPADEPARAETAAMADSPRRTAGPTPDAAPDSRFPQRRALAGENEKPRALPADATPEEVRSFRVTDAMRSIAERLDRKLEVDGRFTLKGALGEYRSKVGVLRIRNEGDVEVFAHELGHAVDFRLANDGRTKAAWNALLKEHEGELRPLDANVEDPAKKTVDEGTAEFLRSYITNPAYARKQAPAFADAFERFVGEHDPELGAILRDASRLSQIDSGMAPTDVFRTMVTFGSEMPRFLKGIKRFNAERKKTGLLPSLGMTYDRMYAEIVSPDHWFKRFQDQLRDARFQKTGKPLPEFGWSDPYKMYRGLPGAKQAASDAIFNGVREYGGSFKDGPVSKPLSDALAKAFGGDVTLVDRPDNPLSSGFSGYLIARRAKALWERFEAGDIQNPPLRASKAETAKAIAQYEAEYPQFADAANDVFDFTRAMWRRKFAAGLIDRDIYETVAGRGDDYVPFFRDLDDNTRVGPSGGNGAGQAGSVVRRFKGSSRQIVDPLHSIIFDTIKTERTIALNDVFKSLHALAEQGGEFSGRFLERIPNTEFKAQSTDLAEGIRSAARARGLELADVETMIRTMEEMIGDDLTATTFRPTETSARGERIAFYWQDGQRVALKFGNDEFSRNFFDTVSQMTTSQRDLLLGMFGKVNGLFSQLITNAPQFGLKNLIVDNMSRIFLGRNTGAMGRVPFASIGYGLHAAVLDREFAKAYAAFGGHRGGVVAAITRELTEARGIGAVAMKPKTWAEQAAHLKGLFEDAAHGRPAPLAIEIAKTPAHALEGIVKLIEGTETIGRLGQAKIVFNYLRKQGLSDEEAFHGALYEARDILDYDRRGIGTNGAIKTLTFLNPNIQGIERANRGLMGAPLQAAIESYRRGGYQHIDESTKTALADAVKNWGMVALGSVATMSYYNWAKDNPVYQRATPYMKQHYYIFPLWDGEDGTYVFTLPKPYDLAGAIFSAIELSMDTIRRGDPAGWSRVFDALKDGELPRQFTSFNALLSGNPFVKVGYEAKTGMKIPFEDGQATPIVPANLKNKAPEEQYNGYTSLLAKKYGEYFGGSPIMADYVLSGLGGTAGKDLNNLATAIFDNQPNVTVKDAMTRMFFGALYRQQKGAGGFRSDFMQVMGSQNSGYIAAANSFKEARRDGDREEAEGIYARGDDLAKTIMTMRSGAFKPELRQLHPLERTEALSKIFSDVTRDLASAQVEMKKRQLKFGEERQFIDLDNPVARSISNTVGSLAAEEIRNGLTIAQVPGYQNFDVIDTSARYEAIKKLSPEVATEITKRMKAAHVLPVEVVQAAWPDLKKRLLQDREKAQIRDLKAIH